MTSKHRKTKPLLTKQKENKKVRMKRELKNNKEKNQP